MTFDSERRRVWTVGPDAPGAPVGPGPVAPGPEVPPAPHTDGAQLGMTVERVPSPALGIVSLSIAVIAAVVVTVAVTVASSALYLVATVLAYGAIALAVIAVLLGLIAVFTRRGPAWGGGGIALGALANPLVLVWLLGVLGSGAPA